MSLPYSNSNNPRDIQRNVETLDSRLVALETIKTPSLLSGSMKISALRTVTGTMATGVNAFALDLTGVSSPGVMVVGMAPATHHTWTWYPHPGLGGLLFNNSGASQTITVNYYVVGT